MLRVPYCPVVSFAKAGYTVDPPKKRAIGTTLHVPPPNVSPLVDPSIIILAMNWQEEGNESPEKLASTVKDNPPKLPTY